MNGKKGKSFLSYVFLGYLIMSSCSSQLVSKNALTVSRGVPFHLELPSNLGRGYQWKLIDTVNYKVLSHDSRSNVDKTQNTDVERFEITTSAKKGRHEVVFYYLRPFEKIIDTASAERFKKVIFVK